MAKKAQKNFEGAMLDLEKIVMDLEKGDIPLEESIKSYKEGMDLASFCLSILKKAEQEIYIYEEESYKKVKGDDLQ